MIKRLLKQIIPSQILWWPRYYTFYRRLNKRDKDLLILDAGCGEGIAAHGLLKRGFRVIGVDKSFEAIRERSAGNRSGIFLVCDLAHLPFKDMAFDIIFSLDVLELIKDVNRVFCEFSRVLNKDGRLTFSIPNDYVCSAKLFTAQQVLRRITPSFLKTRDMPGGKAWLDFTSDEMARKLGCVENYSPDTVIKEAEKLFSVSYWQFFNKVFTSLATDITYGIKWAYYSRFPLFFIAVRIDQYIFKRVQGYFLFFEMKKTR